MSVSPWHYEVLETPTIVGPNTIAVLNALASVNTACVPVCGQITTEQNEVRELSRCAAEIKMRTEFVVGCGWNVDMLTGRCDPITRWFLFLNTIYVWNLQWNFSRCQNTCVGANKTFFSNDKYFHANVFFLFFSSDFVFSAKIPSYSSSRGLWWVRVTSENADDTPYEPGRLV